jgi:RNA-binding protein
MLTGKQKRFLRGLGHGLAPVVTVGKHEITEAVRAQTDEALEAHELIKVKILDSCLMERHEVSDELAAACGADVAQVLGRTFLLYRSAKKPKIEFPR